MFQATRYRLLLSYLVVLASILGVFAIAVRIVFSRSLTHQLTSQLTVLGQGAAANVEFEQGQFKVGEDFSSQDLNARDQALQWFDPQGHLVAQQGKTVLSLPFPTHDRVQIQAGRPRIQGITLPTFESDDKRLIGYIRASQSSAELDETLRKLDWGLGSGIIMALMLSGIGGVWLTRQAMQPIEESFQRLQQFTTDASHELRNPLMAIKSNASVALKYPEGMRPRDTEKFEAIASATNQMTKLTEDLLLLARTNKNPPGDWQTVSLTSILENLVQLYQPQAEAKQISFKAQLAQSLCLLGDASQLSRLFTNLIVNALHYTLEGGTVEVQSSRVGQTLVVKVQDTGIGIAPENLERIFDHFWRADSSRSYWDAGAGLGLAIAQAITQSHGGSVTVTSQVSKGSCFTVRFPAFSSLLTK